MAPITTKKKGQTSVSRRTMGYVSVKLIALDEIWKSFHSNDVELRKYEEYGQSIYSIDELYETCEEEFSLLKGDLNYRLFELNTPVPEKPNIQPEVPINLPHVQFPHIPI